MLAGVAGHNFHTLVALRLVRVRQVRCATSRLAATCWLVYFTRYLFGITGTTSQVLFVKYGLLWSASADACFSLYFIFAPAGRQCLAPHSAGGLAGTTAANIVSLRGQALRTVLCAACLLHAMQRRCVALN